MRDNKELALELNNLLGNPDIFKRLNESDKKGIKKLIKIISPPTYSSEEEKKMLLLCYGLTVVFCNRRKYITEENKAINTVLLKSIIYDFIPKAKIEFDSARVNKKAVVRDLFNKLKAIYSPDSHYTLYVLVGVIMVYSGFFKDREDIVKQVDDTVKGKTIKGISKRIENCIRPHTY